MTVINLNRQTITALPQDTEALLWDETLKGFGFLARRSASGSINRSWIIQYRFKGKQRRLKLGDAAKLNADQARKKAQVLFAQILLDIDPHAAKEAERAEAERLTFSQAVEQYLSMKSGEVRSTSLRTMQMYLTGTKYFPTLHRKALDDVTRSDVASHLDRINTDSGNASAGRARAHLNSFFMWCLRRGHVRENIVLQTEEPKANGKRKRVLTGDELRTVWNACDMQTDFGRIVRLLILTGCRRQEIGSLRWSEVDLKAGTITISAERSKNHQEHVLTLPPLALSIIRSVPQRDGCDYLFGARGKGFVTWGHARAAFKADVDGWTLHDCRRTVATKLADSIEDGGLGIQPHIIEAVLNHISGHKEGDAGTYNRASYKSDIRRALALWAEHVQSIVTGEPSKVVPIPRAA
jgi:integrase